MKTIELRFGDHFAPSIGTGKAHQGIINDIGYVWYGKMGDNVLIKIKQEIIQKNKPCFYEIPEHYRDNIQPFKITKFELANKGVISQYLVSSYRILSSKVSNHSMSPYFIIEKEDKK